MVRPNDALADARSEARSYYRTGMELVRDGRYEDGIELLLRAYQTLPHPNVLGNIARAYALAGRIDEAIEYFEQYRESGPADVEEIVAILDELRAMRDASVASARLAESRAPEPDRVAVGERAPEGGTAGSESTTDAGPGPETAAASAPPVEPPQAPTLSSALAGDASTTPPTYEETITGASRAQASPLDAPASTTIITAQDIRMSGATNVSELLRRAAGVSVMTPTPDAANVGIRGFNRLLSPRVLMLVNGRTTYMDALGVPFWDYQPIHVEDIERIEIIRGPASVLYGANGFSGIVNVVLREPGGATRNEVTIAGGNGRAMRAYASLSGHLARLAYRLHAGYRQVDRFALPFDPARVDETYPLDDPARALRQTHAGGQLRAPLGRGAEALVEFGATRAERLNFYVTGAFLDWVGDYEHAYAMATVQGDLGRVRVFGVHDASRYLVLGSEALRGRLSNEVVDVEAELHRRFRFGFDHDLHVGANYRFKLVELSALADPRIVQHHTGLFFEDTMDAGEHLRIVAAARLDRHPLIDHPVVSPRLALLLQPSDTRTLRVSAGTAFRTPSFQDAYLQIPVPTPVTAVSAVVRGTNVRRTGVEPESIKSFEVGYVDHSSDILRLDLAVYYNRVEHLIGIDPATRLATLADYAGFGASGEGFLPAENAFFYGTSAMSTEPGRYHVLGGELTAHLSPVRGLDVQANYSLNGTRVNRGDGDVAWDRRTSAHMVNVGIQYRFDVGLELSSDLHASSRQVWPELVTTVAGVQRVRMPLPAYFLLNARIAYRFMADRFELALAGWNITSSHKRQHPYGQPLETRIMASLAIRVGAE